MGTIKMEKKEWGEISDRHLCRYSELVEKEEIRIAKHGVGKASNHQQVGKSGLGGGKNRIEICVAIPAEFCRI